MSDAAAKRDEHLAGPGRRVVGVLVAENLGAAVLVDAHGLHGRECVSLRPNLSPARASEKSTGRACGWARRPQRAGFGAAL